MAVVQYKFKSAKDFDSVLIDGHGITVAKLKEKIVLKQKLGGASDFDLVISNADTDEEYLDESFVVSENASVLVRRVPMLQEPINSGTVIVSTPESSIEMDGANVHASDEDMKIKEFVDASAAQWIRQTQDVAATSRTQVSSFQRKVPPAGYTCHRCGVAGHFIQFCPTNGDSSYDIKKVKMPSGIPKTMLVANPDGSYALPSGEAAVLQPNEEAFAKEIHGVNPGELTTEVPSELRCPLCQHALRDAVLTSKCCFKSFCDKCIRDVLLDKATCVCGAKNIRADDLLPNKTLRETVERVLSGSSFTGLTSVHEKPQSQDSTTTHVTVSNSVECKADDDAEANAENEEIEELDYDEEGFDDLNLDDELEAEEPVKSPETKASDVDPSGHSDKEPDQALTQDPVNKQDVETKPQVLSVEAPKPSSVNGRNGRKPHQHPYAVQYTGYWAASQMIGDACRPPYGYGGYFPGPYSAPVHFPFQTYGGARPPHKYMPRKDFESRKYDARRQHGNDRRNRLNHDNSHQKSRDDNLRGAAGRDHRPRSKTPPRRRRSRSPPAERPRSSSPHCRGRESPSPNNDRRRSASPPSVKLRSVSPVRRGRASGHTRSPVKGQCPVQRSPGIRERTRSRSPPRYRNADGQRYIRSKDAEYSPERRPRPQPAKLEPKEAREARVPFESRYSHANFSTRWSQFQDDEPARSPPEQEAGRGTHFKISANRPVARQRMLYEEDAADDYIHRNRNGSPERFSVRETAAARPVQRENSLRRPLLVSRFEDEMEGMEVPRKTVLRAARGISLEPGNRLNQAEYRQLLDEFEQSQRPPVRMSMPNATLPRRNRVLMRRPRPALPPEDLDDDFGNETMKESVQRTAVYTRPDGPYGFDNDEAEVDNMDERVDGNLVRRFGRRKPLQRFLDDDELMNGDALPPSQMPKKKSLLERLGDGKARMALARKREEEQDGALVVQNVNRQRKKLKRGSGLATAPSTSEETNCRLTPVKSVFERISFNSKKSNRPGSGGQAGGRLSGAGGQRVVVFYGDV